MCGVMNLISFGFYTAGGVQELWECDGLVNAPLIRSLCLLLCICVRLKFCHLP